MDRIDDLCAQRLRGRRVRDLGAWRPAEGPLWWDAVSDTGERMSPGVYFARLRGTAPAGPVRRPDPDDVDPVAALDAGVHTIGKKIVEEAGQLRGGVTGRVPLPDTTAAEDFTCPDDIDRKSVV